MKDYDERYECGTQPGSDPWSNPVTWFLAMAVCATLLSLACSTAPEIGPDEKTPTPQEAHEIAPCDTCPGMTYTQAVESFAAAMAAAETDSVPPLLTIVQWLAANYDVSVTTNDELQYSALAPTTGSPAVLYRWQYECWVSSPPFPPELVGDVGYRVECALFVGAEVDSVRARVAAVDGAGVQGPWSVWSVTTPLD